MMGVNLGKWPELPDGAMHDAALDGFTTLRYLDWQHVNYRMDRPMPSPDDDWHYSGQPWREWCGVPIEVCTAHAHARGAQPWLHIHHQVTALGLWDIYKRLQPYRAGAKPILEFSNEVWNANFPQYHDCVKYGYQQHLADDDFRAAMSYLAAMTIKMRGVWRDEALIVLSGQCRNPWVMEWLMQQWDVARKVDAIAIAPYFRHAHEIPELVEFVKRHRDIADAYGVELWTYEAGQEMRGAVAAEANRSKEMGAWYEQLIDGIAPYCDRIVLYNAASYYRNDAWGLCEWIDGGGIRSTPKHRAIADRM